MELWASGEAFPVHAVIKILAVPASIPKIHEALVHVSSARREEHSVRIPGALGNDVDHRVDGVRSPDCATGPANHFDPIDILEQSVLPLPIDTMKKRRINAPAI